MHVASCALHCIMLYTFPDSQEHMAIVLVTRHERLWGKEDVKNFGLEQLKFHQQVRLGMDSWTLLSFSDHKVLCRWIRNDENRVYLFVNYVVLLLACSFAHVVALVTLVTLTHSNYMFALNGFEELNELNTNSSLDSVSGIREIIAFMQDTSCRL